MSVPRNLDPAYPAILEAPKAPGVDRARIVHTCDRQRVAHELRGVTERDEVRYQKLIARIVHVAEIDIPVVAQVIFTITRPEIFPRGKRSAVRPEQEIAPEDRRRHKARDFLELPICVARKIAHHAQDMR